MKLGQIVLGNHTNSTNNARSVNSEFTTWFYLSEPRTTKYADIIGLVTGCRNAYLNKAIDLGGDTYYFHRVKSLAEAELGDYKAAVKSAKKSLELAQAEGKDEFVRMNQKNIEVWNGKLNSKN